MAQLNPNFEIDYSDINSYEQIQLLNDAQQAKENLLMHKAYKEPSDDEIIRNRFSSFTFVDFCPKIYTRSFSSSSSSLLQQTQHQPPVNNNESSTSGDPVRYLQLEKFSDLFDRINSWLKLNKDWRICSMQTLIYDCATQFNHLKSSIYAQYLPRNTRGLRLYLSPSRSKFAGPQKIGCINVVPRKIAGSYSGSNGQVQYENADQILARLNELLLTKTIEGRILSVDTITLPLVKGYVDTESNYISDERLNGLYQRIYCSTRPGLPDTQSSSGSEQLIDILRVYYEFGHTTCGLVNLIDFVPRFYSPTPTDAPGDGQQVDGGDAADARQRASSVSCEPVNCEQKTLAAESMTRLIRRSLAWFEVERKAILTQQNTDTGPKSGPSKIKLKLCNLQVLQKTLTKRDLLRINGPNAIDILDTRSMSHLGGSPSITTNCEFCRDKRPEASTWCIHAQRLSRLYDVKFVRLAYVIPIQSRFSCSIQAPERWRLTPKVSSTLDSRESIEVPVVGSVIDSSCYLQTDQQLSESSNSLTCSSESSISESDCCSGSDLGGAKKDALEETNLLALSSMNILTATTERHLVNERLNQSKELDDHLNNSPVGQLTYRLFAPCQLVTSSSCFSINPVNSSSPLSRRGFVNLNGNESSNSSQTSNLFKAASSGAQVQSNEPAEAGILNSRLYDFAGQLVAPGVMKCTTSGGSGSSSGQHRQSIGESEQVEAIRRRMEVYVTTNQMKVVAGETIVVNLSNALSCLSSALEQTVVESQHLRVEPSSWLSVNLLYVGVGEPQLPQQLVAEQKIRELMANKNLTDNPTEEEVDCLFDSDFNGCLKVDSQTGGAAAAAPEVEELSLDESLSQTFCNVAYERTVALPSKPEKSEGSSSFDASTMADLVRHSMSVAHPKSPRSHKTGLVLGARTGKRKLKKNEAQCSIM